MKKYANISKLCKSVQIALHSFRKVLEKYLNCTGKVLSKYREYTRKILGYNLGKIAQGKKAIKLVQFFDFNMPS